MYSWWFRNPAITSWGLEKRSHYLQGFHNISGGCLGFLNHQHYDDWYDWYGIEASIESIVFIHTEHHMHSRKRLEPRFSPVWKGKSSEPNISRFHVVLPSPNSSPLQNRPGPKRMAWYSNHPFSGAKMLVFAGVFLQAWFDHLQRHRSLVVDLCQGQLRSQVERQQLGQMDEDL